MKVLDLHPLLLNASKAKAKNFHHFEKTITPKNLFKATK